MPETAMFIFQRDREAAGPAEIWRILLPEDERTDTEARFGSGVRVRPWEELFYHDLGFVVAIPATRAGKDTVKCFLACQEGLTEEEKATLFRELEMLIGKYTHAYGTEERAGWFWSDELYDASGDAPAGT
jgi:hypothetical protein